MSGPAGLVIRPAIIDADLDAWRLVRRTVLPNESIAHVVRRDGIQVDASSGVRR